jgi:hypothetical protein
MHHATIITSLGPFQVTTAAKAVEAFSAALGFAPGYAGVPLTYPIRLLTECEIASAIEPALPGGIALIHQAQRFISHAPLEVNETYRLDLKLERVQGRHSRLLIRGAITGADHRLMQEFLTTLMVLQ